MKIAVRYYSRSGNTRAAAEAIARAAGVEAVSVDAPDAAIGEPVDLLFIGGALYAYGLDRKLRAYLDTLSNGNVARAAVFSTAWLSKHALDLIKGALKDKGIPVDDETWFAKNTPDAEALAAAEKFAKERIEG